MLSRLMSSDSHHQLTISLVNNFPIRKAATLFGMSIMSVIIKVIIQG